MYESIALIAKKYGATEAQINIVWLLHCSPRMRPIPVNSSLKHFEENLVALSINLSTEAMTYLK